MSINQSQMGPAWVPCLLLDMRGKVLIIEEEPEKDCVLERLKSSPVGGMKATT